MLPRSAPAGLIAPGIEPRDDIGIARRRQHAQAPGARIYSGIADGIFILRQPRRRHDEAPQHPGMLTAHVTVVVAYRRFHPEPRRRKQPRVVDQPRQQAAQRRRRHCRPGGVKRRFSPCQHSK